MCQSLQQSGLLNALGIANRTDRKVIGQAVNNLATDYNTNLMNNVVTRHRCWIKVLFIAFRRQNGQDDPDNGIIRDTLNYLCNEHDVDDAAPAPAAAPIQNHDREFVGFLGK